MTSNLKSSPSNPPNNHQNQILKTAISSRLLLIALIVLWPTLVHPYDTSSPLNLNCLSSNSLTLHHHNQKTLLSQIGSAIEDRIMWDSVYFVSYRFRTISSSYWTQSCAGIARICD
ncbi:hypothetical protein P3X46_026555 [Hevea brasiliensis]|uniref:Transmembrane protein n=1 Tax=Hevea brasiliensis TaxID=3981 RepID=A0ABQ9L0F6_HEVBR|nr:hypothetical protein P3X46_026555 [Hevea brasiliensis]